MVYIAPESAGGLVEESKKRGSEILLVKPHEMGLVRSGINKGDESWW